MVLGGGDGDAGGPAVDQHTARERGELGEDLGAAPLARGLALGQVDGGREVAGQPREHGGDLGLVLVAGDDRDRAEALLQEEVVIAAVGGQALGGDGEEAGADGVLAARARGHGGVHVGEFRALGDARDEVVAHTVVEEHARAGVADGVGEGLDEAVTVGAGGREDEAGLHAELADAERHRAREPGADLLGALGSGLGRDDHGVEGAEFAVEGDRHGTGGRRVEEGASAPYGTGESGGRDQRVPDELDARLEPVDQAEDALRDAVPGGGPAQHGGDQFGGGGVVGVRLDDDGAARGERARGVAAGYGEGEREVRGRVDGDDAQRHLVATQVRDRRGGRVVGVVDDDAQEGTLVDDVREGAQLVAGAGEFTGEADGTESGLRVRGLHQVVLRGVEELGGAAQEGRAHGAVREGSCGGASGADRLVHLLGCGFHRNLLPLLPGSGVDTPDWCCCHRGSLQICAAHLTTNSSCSIC